MELSILRLLEHFLVGTVISFFVAIPLGPVNLAVIQSTVDGFKKRAYLISIGSGLAELFYCALSVGALSFLFESGTQQEHMILALHVLSVPLLLFLGLSNLIKKPEEEQEPVKKSRLLHGGILLGFSLNISNPGILALWTSVSALLKSKNIVIARTTDIEGIIYMLFYIVGVGFGTVLTHLMFIRMAAHRRFSFNKARKILVSRIIGWLFVGLGVYQAITLLFKYYFENSTIIISASLSFFSNFI